MTTRLFQIIQATAKRLTVLLLGALMILGLVQTAVSAAPLTKADPDLPSEARLEQMRDQRREWQNQASAEAAQEAAIEAEEGVAEKLNLDEITEENPAVTNARKAVELDN
ncbi:MAG: hypothetical protein F6J97_23165 [Leptolyngbya sp. SIO4C1]|nr:hypothetical protein [Leptolyngbya sp. SIO4C1]